MSYHNSNVSIAEHYRGDARPPRLVTRELGYYGYLGVDKQALKAAKLDALKNMWAKDEKKAREVGNTLSISVTAKKTADGKAAVPIASLIGRWNADGAKIIKPFAPAINGARAIPAALRRKIIERPLDAILDIFNPVFDTFGRAIDRVLAKHVPTGKINWFGKMVNIRRVQPNDRKLDVSGQAFLLKIRTIQAFIGLFFNKPLELAAECIAEGVDIARNVGEAVGDAVQAVGKAVGDTIDNTVKAAQDAAEAVGDWFGQTFKLGSLGEAFLASLAALATAIAGLGVWQLCALIVTALIAATVVIVPVAIGASISMETAKLDAEVKLAEIEAGKNTTLPVKVIPPAFTGQGGGTPTGGGTGTGQGDGTPTGGGIPPFAIVAGAAALAFLVLRSSK